MIIFYAVAGNHCFVFQKLNFERVLLQDLFENRFQENSYNVRFPTRNKFKLLQWMIIIANVFSLFFFFNFYTFTARVHDLITGQGAKISQAGQCSQKNISLKGVLFIPFSNLKTKVKVKDFLLKWKYMKYPRTFPIFINAYCISTMLPQHCKFIYLCQYHGLLGQKIISILSRNFYFCRNNHDTSSLNFSCCSLKCST